MSGLVPFSRALKAFNDLNVLNGLTGGFLPPDASPVGLFEAFVPEREEIQAGLVAVDEFIRIVTMQTNVDQNI